MTPPTVNAYYNPSMNDINFPAGILQPPFFDPDIDPAVNFGGIGVVIGHEMTHGFDDEGSKYDGHGNLREWQTAEDRKKFVERTDCEVAEYGGFEAAPAHGECRSQKLNGKLTLGENTADNGGLRIAYMALTRRPGQGRQVHQRQDRRLHRGAALLPRICPGLVPESDRTVSSPVGTGRSPLARPLARERHGAELRRVRQGIRLPQGTANVPRELLPRLVDSPDSVEVAELGGPRLRWFSSPDSMPVASFSSDRTNAYAVTLQAFPRPIRISYPHLIGTRAT